MLNVLLDSSADEDTAPNELPPFPTFTRSLETLPKTVKLDNYREAVEYDQKSKQLKVMKPVLPSEEGQILAMVDVLKTDEEDQPFVKKSDTESAARSQRSRLLSGL